MITPSLAEVIRNAIDTRLGNLQVALPGRVEKYDAATQTADVQPQLIRVIKDADGNEVQERYPKIPSVPVLFPRSGAFFVSLPIQVGDTVLLVFCDYSIDQWRAKGRESVISDDRPHGLHAAVAIPGLFPDSGALSDAHADDLVIGKDDDGMQIRVTSDDKVQVTYDGGQTLEIEGQGASAKMTLGAGDRAVALYQELKTAYDAHVHPTGVGPSGVPSSLLPTNVASSKLLVPAG
jgi:hypothetical protein